MQIRDKEGWPKAYICYFNYINSLPKCVKTSWRDADKIFSFLGIKISRKALYITNRRRQTKLNLLLKIDKIKEFEEKNTLNIWQTKKIFLPKYSI